MKKLSLLLASIGAGLLLVGGTVAAYIVTAAPNKGVRVTPGTLENDDTGHITLNWGANTISDVQELVPGVEKNIGNVELVANSTDVSNVDEYQGKFTVSLQNTSEVGSGENLLDYLIVRCYAGESEVLKIDGTASETTKSHTTVAQTLRASVELDFSAQALDEADYTAISEQTVYVEFSWGPKDDDEESENIATLYFVNKLGYDEPWFFAQDGAKRNAKYPGIKMTYAYNTEINSVKYGVYTVEFDVTKYSTYIFSDNGDDTDAYTVSNVTAAQKADIKDGDAPTVVAGVSGFSGVPTKALSTFYLRGKFGTDLVWGHTAADLSEDYALVPGNDNRPFIIKELIAGDEFKIYAPAGDGTWISPNGENYVIHAVGEYDHEGDNGTPGTYVICADILSEQVTLHDGWTDYGSYQFYIDNLDNNPQP